MSNEYGKLSEFLHNDVYPRIDAAEAGLLDEFNPKLSSGRGAYALTCPLCKKPREAYYYPGSVMIHCHRKNNCGQPTRLWDAIQESTKLDNSGMVRRLCDVAGVPAPNAGNKAEREQFKGASFLTEAIKRITRDALIQSPDGMNYLLSERRFAKEDLQLIGLGFYPSDQYIRDALSKEGCDLKMAEEWGLVLSDEEKLQKKRSLFSNRVVGFWKQIDGSIRLWSRAIVDDGLPKYLFARGTDKSQPYGWSGGSARNPLVVEGTLDRESLVLMGYNSLAIGQAGVNAAQAAFFAKHGVYELTHMTDGDRAGLRGGMDTIRNCEPIGITVYLAVLPEGADDADKLRAGGKKAVAAALINGAITAGEFLARKLLLALDRGGPNVAQFTREVLQVRADLTPASALQFDRVFLRYGLQPIPVKAAGLRLAANLVVQGFDDQQIERRVRESLGLKLNLAQKEGS
jgi:DNA primase